MLDTPNNFNVPTPVRPQSSPNLLRGKDFDVQGWSDGVFD
jgi:hypothetical protein